MASISIAISRGIEGSKISDFTVSTNAPGSGDTEIRFNVQDANSVNQTVKDIVLALKAFQRALENRSLQLPAGTPWIGQPIL